MSTAETFHPRDLSDGDAADWRALCATDSAYGSPLMGPEFAQAVGEVRDDARVTIWRDGAAMAGVLAYHRRPGAFARPIGAPLADYHGPILTDGLDFAEALQAAGLSAYRFTGLTSGRGGIEGGAAKESFAIDLDGSADDYLEALRAASPKRFKNYRRLDHKLDREVGALRIVADADPEAFDRLIAWKRDQIGRTGVHDFLGAAWTGALMRNLFERREGGFQGLMLNLYAGDRLVAGHFGARRGATYHPWIASTDPELAAWSPGQVFLGRAIAAMPDLGLSTYDLGTGHEHYKRPYAMTVRPVGEGLATAKGAAGRVAQASEQAWTLAGARGDGPLGRLRRRLDAIATVELSLAGRTRGLAQALATGGRRTAMEAA
jgi:CelD/BcsL family acetyltransferase involved in cellulose biosynthesis